MTKIIQYLLIAVCVGYFTTAQSFTAEANDNEFVFLEVPEWNIDPDDVEWLWDIDEDGNQVYWHRGGAYNSYADEIYVHTRIDGQQEIAVINPENGELDGYLSRGEDDNFVDGGDFDLADVDVTRDGQIFAINLIDGGGNYKVYRWENSDSEPELVFEEEINQRFGDSFGISGTGEDLSFVTGAFGNENVAVSRFDADEGMFGEAQIFDTGNADYARGGIAEIVDEDSVWVNGPDAEVRKMSLETGELGTVIENIPAQTKNVATGIVNEGSEHERSLLTAGPKFPTAKFHLADVSDYEDISYIASTFETEDDEDIRQNVQLDGFTAIDTERNRLIVHSSRNPMKSYSLSEVVTSTGGSIITELPDGYDLAQNYPNPFNPSTNIEYEIPEATHVKLEVFNAAGEHVQTIVDSEQSAGTHTATFDAGNLASGTYIYRLQAGQVNVSRTMTFVK